MTCDQADALIKPIERFFAGTRAERVAFALHTHNCPRCKKNLEDDAEGPPMDPFDEALLRMIAHVMAMSDSRDPEARP